MKKPQNRFIEEIEKDSAGSFAGSSENRSSGAGVAGKNDSSRKCGARGDLLFTTSDECLEILPSRNADTEIFEGTKAEKARVYAEFYDSEQKENYIEILQFTHFSKFWNFNPSKKKGPKKEKISSIRVTIVLHLVCGNTSKGSP